MVRTPQASGDEDIFKLAAHRSNTFLLGSRILRILRTGTCQQNRVHRQRRSVQPDAAQGDPGGNITHGIHTCCNGYVQRSGPTMEPFRRILLPDHGCILRLSEVNRHIFDEKSKKNLDCKKKCLPLQSQTTKRSVRITVSTQDSQSCNRGSIPLPTTKKARFSASLFHYLHSDFRYLSQNS